MSSDFETRLDDMLTQVASGAPPDAALADEPEIANLVAVAGELQFLAPTPQPRLAGGRRRFLDEATRLVQSPRLLQRATMHPARAFGITAVFVLIVIGVLVIAGTSFFAGNVPAVSSLTWTMSPTHQITPTGTTTAPMNRARFEPTLMTCLKSPPPKPVPTPMLPRD